MARRQGGRAVNQLVDLVEGRFTFPVELSTIRTEIGGVVLEAPNASDALTVEEVLAHLDEETFDTPTALYETLSANLPEQYVGRKYSSDRGIVVDETYDGPLDVRNRSL